MKTIPDLEAQALELVRRTSTALPGDVVKALEAGRSAEADGSPAHAALTTILENVNMAREGSTPICQDTGTPLFFVKHPWDYPTGPIQEALTAGVVEATARSLLRPNAVDPITGKNSGNNQGPGLPVFNFEQWDRADEVQIDLMLKGGGSENVTIQYSLPYAPLKAGRDLEGVRRVVLDAIYKAQGKGCAPGTLGVCIGSDRSSGYKYAKVELLRKLDDTNPDPKLAEFEEQLTKEMNSLGIGPMGFGGKTTVLGVKACAKHRHPASFFVTVAYLCWANRRGSLTYTGGEFNHG